MKNDIDKITFEELDHFVGVFHQMGRVALPSDLNEQNELVLRLIQRLAGDAVHTGSPNEGFRIGTHQLLDRMDSRQGWTATPAAARVFVDYFNHRIGDGSLAVRGATGVSKSLLTPLDLTGLVEIVLAVNMVAGSSIGFEVSDGTTQHAFTISTIATTGPWTLLRALPGSWPPALAVNRITRYGFTGLDASRGYGIDSIEIDLPLRTLLVDPEFTEGASASGVGAVLAVDDDQRLFQRRSLRVSGATALRCRLPEPVDASRARAMLVSLRRSSGAALPQMRLYDSATPERNVTLAAGTVFSQNGWEVHRFALAPPGAFDWAAVSQFEIRSLSSGAADTYHLGPVLLESNPALDLVVMGGDGTAEGAGRFHGDGLAAVKEATGTYAAQKDLPAADPAALAAVAESRQRIDWAYLDLWERPLSFAERPDLRDVALGGLDTTTRTQLVAQVRLLRGVEVPTAATAEPPAAAFANLQRLGQGVLSTKDKPAAAIDPCADPCEPAITGPYLGEDNRLFRVEIHRAGHIGAAAAPGTAHFKWSRENAGTVTPLQADALAGATSALVEAPELFAIGDLIEISNDLVELVTGPYEDRVGHRNHQRGELRRITSINIDTRRVAWDHAGPLDPLVAPFHAALTLPQRVAQHAKIVRWDGVAACVAGDIVLADGVVIEFGGQAFAPADHWLFATRTADRSVERLVEAPPRGIRHAYYKLAAIHRSRGAGPAPEIVYCEDLRPRLAALPELDASRVDYDPGAGIALPVAPTDWARVGTVQEAIDSLLRAQMGNDMRLHNKLLHGYGVIAGLQLRCVPPDRESLKIMPGYALDCEGNLIHNDRERGFKVVDSARTQSLLTADSGKVNLWIERGAGGFVERLEKHEKQSILEEVLEGGLLLDFFKKVIAPLFLFFETQLQPFPDRTLPLEGSHKRALTFINLLWQLVNPTTGRYMWLSKAEHDLLEKFHDDLVALLSSQGSYCALFDPPYVTPFPSYPYSQPTGIETLFAAMHFHRRVRVDPTGRWAASCGFGPKVQLFDLSTGEAVLLSPDHPGGPDCSVRDVAFNASGTVLYSVATLEQSGKLDSHFARANITPPTAPATVPGFSWDTATTVCDTSFVSLATHPAQPNRLYAIGRSATDATRRGLYRLDPAAIPAVPSVWINCNAVGPLAINDNGNRAVLSEHSNGAIQNGESNRLRVVDLNTGSSTTPMAMVGREHFGEVPVEDLAVAGGVVYFTGLIGGQTHVQRFTLVPGPPLPSANFQTPGLWRLLPLPTRNLLVVSEGGACAAAFYSTNGPGGSIVPRQWVPAQIVPMSLAALPSGRDFVMLNGFSNTLNRVDVDRVQQAPTQTFTAIPPVTLAVYRHTALRAFTDLAGVLLQYLKDGFFDRFLVDPPACTRDDKVFLGVVEIKNGRVEHICNFSKRHYAKSFRTWSYWLSALPLLPLLKTVLKRLACAKLLP